MIPISLPKIGKEEVHAVVKVPRSGMLTSGLGAGPMVTKFGKRFPSFPGVKYTVAVNTGIAALYSAVMACRSKAR